jgi:hypothetical protein
VSDEPLVPGATPAPVSGSASGLSVSSWMFLAVVGLAVHGVFLRDHIPVAQGLGYDGETYGSIALMPERLFDLPFNRVQRCLPSLLAHLAIRGLGLPPTARSVVAVFSAMNAVLLVAGLGIWLRIAARLRLRTPSTVFGFCGLFVSFAGATMPYYYPVLTDTWALFLGLLVALFYLQRSRFGLLAVFLVSGLVWPSLLLFMVPLIVFPAGEGRIPSVRSPAWRDRMALGSAVLVVALTAWALIQGGWSDPIDALVPLSLAVLAGYVFQGTRLLLGSGASASPRVRPAGLAPTLARAAAVLALFLLLQSALASAFPRPTEYWQRPTNLAVLILASAARAPGAFLVGHAANFGVLVLLVVAFWRRICAVAAEMGLGAWLFLAGCLAFSLNAESRHSNALWPMLVTLACVALDRLPWPRPWLLVFCGVSLFNSRALVLFNGDFPRLYFANFALTMDPAAYAVQALGFGAVAAYLHLLWLATQGRQGPAEASLTKTNPEA